MPGAFTKYHQSRLRQTQERQDKYLALIAQGATVAAAAEGAGVHKATPERWAREDREFRERRDEIRRLQRDARFADAEEAGDVTPLDGTFATFRKAMFNLETYYHQAKIIEAIENAPPMEIVLVNLPPEHGKTTVLVDFICRTLALEPDTRITYVSEGQGLARRVVGQVKNRMTRADLFPEFITRYGPFHLDEGGDSDRAWTADYIKVHKADADEKDYSLEARGWKSAISGTRADILLIDDLQSLRSLNLTDQMVETIRQDFLSRVGKFGKVVMVGTRVGDGDIYDRLIELDLIHTYVNLPAVDRHGKALCPEMWDEEQLAKRKKQVGPIVWNRTYQQRPNDAGDKTFPKEILEIAQNDELGLYGRMEDGSNAAAGMLRAMTLDPALGGMCSIEGMAFDSDRLVMLDAVNRVGLGRWEQIFALIDGMAAQVRPAILVVEKNAMQKGIARDERLRKLGRKHGFRIVEHETGRNKTDPMIGIAQMPADFRAGRIWVPNADEECKRKFDPLLTQLHRWRPDVPTRSLQQDAVMAFWFGWLQWEQRRHRVTDSLEAQWKTEGVRDFLQYEQRMVS